MSCLEVNVDDGTRWQAVTVRWVQPGLPSAPFVAVADWARSHHLPVRASGSYDIDNLPTTELEIPALGVTVSVPGDAPKSPWDGTYVLARALYCCRCAPPGFPVDDDGPDSA
jgi:hypothetical protein